MGQESRQYLFSCERGERPMSNEKRWRIEERPQGWGNSTVVFKPDGDAFYHELYPTEKTLSEWRDVVNDLNELSSLREQTRELTEENARLKNENHVFDSELQAIHNELEEVFKESYDYSLTVTRILDLAEKARDKAHKQNLKKIAKALPTSPDTTSKI
jgi:uncharacterized protein YhaN